MRELPKGALMRRYVIIGAGLAGHRGALELRRLDPQASIDLIGNEEVLPYDRPPLSKDVLLGKVASTTLMDADRYEELDIRFHPGVRANSIDRSAQTVGTDRGQRFPYDALLIATGSRPRRLPGVVTTGLNLCYLRTAADAVRLRDELRPGARVAVVGGGFIGLEAAAAARARGCDVSVLESADRILSRGLPVEAARYVHSLHTRNGIRIVTGARLEEIRGHYELQTQTETFKADTVVVGVGILPNIELAAAAGLELDDGIVVDGTCRTADPHIYAAGEVTAHPVPFGGRRRRLESWKVAQAQPLVAASAMTGRAGLPYAELPWLWSDQFDLNLQLLGMPERAAQFRVRGNPEGASWTLVGLDEQGLPVSGVAINAGRDIAQLRRSITRGTALPEDFF